MKQRRPDSHMKQTTNPFRSQTPNSSHWSTSAHMQCTTLWRPWGPLIIALLFTITFAFVILTQNEKTGFEPNHHGWVSSHGLAIAQNASPETRLVGYTLKSRDQFGSPEYYYFDRYPVFFSGTLHFLTKHFPDLSTRIYVSRHAMVIIFLINLVIAYRLLLLLTDDVFVSLSASFLAFSGYYFMFYKDMVHFDQPALLAITLLLYAISVHKTTKKITFLYIATIIAVSFGRAYPAVFILSLWWTIELFSTLRLSSKSPVFELRPVALSHASGAFLLAVLMSAIYLAHNVYTESVVRTVSIADTSIIKSAQRRLPFNVKVVQEEPLKITWRKHATSQAERLIVGATPYPFGVLERYQNPVKIILRRAGWPASVMLLTLGALIIGVFIWRQPPNRRPLWALVGLSGFAWLIPMKNLAVPHDYTTIYHLGLYLVLFSAIASWIPKRLRPVLAFASIGVFLLANTSVNMTHNEVAEEANKVTKDFERIRAHLKPGQNIYVYAPNATRHTPDGSAELIPGLPYAAAFYLHGHYFTGLDQATIAISRNSDALCPYPTRCDLVPLGNEAIHIGRIHR